VRRSREKRSESAILKILSPVRLPFRHTGNLYFIGDSYEFTNFGLMSLRCCDMEASIAASSQSQSVTVVRRNS
jgi:hypothetical protein